MIKVIEEAIINGGTSTGRDDGKERQIDLSNMPLLLDLYKRSRAIGVSLDLIAPLMRRSDYREGRPCSATALFRMYQRGKDPQQIVGVITMHQILENIISVLDMLMINGVFGVLGDDGFFQGDYPRRGPSARKFIHSKFMELV